MRQITKLSSTLIKLPFDIDKRVGFQNFEILYSKSKEIYIYQNLSLEEYQTYLELNKLSPKIKSSIYEKKYDNSMILLYEYEEKTSKDVKIEKSLEVLEVIFEKSSYENKLNKNNLININNIFKVLDNKFNYFEMRIRQIETNPIKTDVSWIVLAKYNIILDTKIYLYDLQTDIFNAIDKEQIVNYGIIMRNPITELYSNKKLLADYNIYFGPIGMLYARYSLNNDINILEKIKKIDKFNQKYFLFMSLYILILNINIPMIIDEFNVNNYLLITKKIKGFINNYLEILKM